MAKSFENVHLASMPENGQSKSLYESPVRLDIVVENFELSINVLNGKYFVSAFFNSASDLISLPHYLVVASYDTKAAKCDFS